MAGHSEEACQVLLDKLRQGQVDLHRNLQHLRPKRDPVDEKFSRPLRVSHVRYRRGCGDYLCCVKHLPVRRARTEQLSPSTPPSHAPRRKYRKRLSSTPKHSSPPPPPLLPHSHLPSSQPTLSSTDISLENALLSHSSHSKTHSKRSTKISGTKKESGAKSKGNSKTSVTGTSLIAGSLTKQKEVTKQGPGITKEEPDIMGETVQEVSATQNSVSGVVSQSTSVRSRYESDTRKKKNPRGLTVSFITDENSSCSKMEGRGKGSGGGVGLGSKRRSGEMSFSEEKERREQLINSLNSSPFGALEHSRRSKLRPPNKTPRVTRSPASERAWPWRVREEERLGYDWIAGMVDAGSLLEDRDEDWFQEMREFRKVNHSECSRPHPLFLPDTDTTSEDDHSLSTSHNLTSSHSATGHTHCTRSYVLNDRLFPMTAQCESGEGGRRCPVCEGKREKGKDDATSIHYIRVSVPRRSVVAPYNLRPHRRRSFDPSDSMALNKHCMAGWNSTRPPSLPPQPTVDLRSHLTTTPHHPTSHGTLPTHHSSPSVNTNRGKRTGGRSAVSSSLLNTSHRAEYNLRSRGHQS